MLSFSSKACAHIVRGHREKSFIVAPVRKKGFKLRVFRLDSSGFVDVKLTVRKSDLKRFVRRNPLFVGFLKGCETQVCGMKHLTPCFPMFPINKGYFNKQIVDDSVS